MVHLPRNGTIGFDPQPLEREKATQMGGVPLISHSTWPKEVPSETRRLGSLPLETNKTTMVQHDKVERHLPSHKHATHQGFLGLPVRTPGRGFQPKHQRHPPAPALTALTGLHGVLRATTFLPADAVAEVLPADADAGDPQTAQTESLEVISSGKPAGSFRQPPRK